MAENLTTLTWLIPAGPLLAFFVIILFLRQFKTASWMLAWTAIGISLVLSWTVAFNMFSLYGKEAPSLAHESAEVVMDDHGEESAESEHGATEEEAGHGETAGHEESAQEEGGHEKSGEHHLTLLDKKPVQIASSVVWMPFGEYTEQECRDCIRMGVAVDPLTAIMLFMVPFAVFMIFIYSVGYHNYGAPKGRKLGVPNHGEEEPLFSRFFAFMSLFAGAMLTLVVADNLLLLFVGWEVMGLCSYLLIGFWYARTYGKDPKNPQKLPPRYASIKAFMTTRVADVVMLMGIVFFFRVFGTLNFQEALSAESLKFVMEHTVMGMPGGLALAVMALLLFTGTVGKSAQWPLHVWLPNAMEGPTPVSAVIHAAAMVSAGIYLILRLFPLIAVASEAYPNARFVIAFIGAFTALMAATIAVAQDDVKGVLAYSTISQLGFMVAAVGIGAYIAAMFHLITHAYFKALLFLSSGSVIHGMEHGAEHVHDHHTDPQDMMNMGGLKDKMPITWLAFLIGGLALSGFPIVTAGFWSKDEIFADAWTLGSHGDALAMAVFVTLAIAAFLTAFYTARQLCLTFLGKPRTPLASHAHESNSFMVWPLIFLSVFAIGAGWVGIPEDFLGTSGVFTNYFHHFAGATLYETFKELYSSHLIAHGLEAPPFHIVPIVTSVAVALGGLTLGWLVYGLKPLQTGQIDPLKKLLGPIHTFLLNKWYWDELYQIVFIKPVTYFSEVIVFKWIDKGLIDGLLHQIANFFYTAGAVSKYIENLIFNRAIDSIMDGFLWISREFRSIQTGRVQEYALISTLIVSVLAVVILYIAGALGTIF